VTETGVPQGTQQTGENENLNWGTTDEFNALSSNNSFRKWSWAHWLDNQCTHPKVQRCQPRPTNQTTRRPRSAT